MVDKTKEVWLHNRQGLTSSKKVVSMFTVLDQDLKLTEKEQGYTLRGVPLIIGGIYDVEVERTDDSCVLMPSSLIFREIYPDAELVQKLKAEKAIFLQQQDRRRFEKRYMQGFKMPETLNGMASILITLKTWDQMQSFQAMIIEEVRKRAKAMGG